jgi:serine O-acetyltransferase
MLVKIDTVDIHPAARLGKGILIDHGAGVVIGETAVVGDDVSMLYEVTLGGTGKQAGERHPKVGNGVLIGAGAIDPRQCQDRQWLPGGCRQRRAT